MTTAYGKASQGKLWVALAGAAVVLVGAAAVTWVLVRRRPRAAASDVPTDLNGFVVAALLREVRNKPTLTPGQRAALDADLASVERYYFSPDTNGDPPPDLRRLVDRWATAA